MTHHSEVRWDDISGRYSLKTEVWDVVKNQSNKNKNRFIYSSTIASKSKAIRGDDWSYSTCSLWAKQNSSISTFKSIDKLSLFTIIRQQVPQSWCANRNAYTDRANDNSQQVFIRRSQCLSRSVTLQQRWQVFLLLQFNGLRRIRLFWEVYSSACRFRPVRQQRQFVVDSLTYWQPMELMS